MNFINFNFIYLYRILDGELEMKIESLEKTMEEMRATVSELQEQISALYGKMMFFILLHFKCYDSYQCVGYVKKDRFIDFIYSDRIQMVPQEQYRGHELEPDVDDENYDVPDAEYQ